MGLHFFINAMTTIDKNNATTLDIKNCIFALSSIFRLLQIAGKYITTTKCDKYIPKLIFAIVVT